jgi:hypothetical protein
MHHYRYTNIIKIHLHLIIPFFSITVQVEQNSNEKTGLPLHCPSFIRDLSKEPIQAHFALYKSQA